MIRVNATFLVAMMTWALLPNCNGLTATEDDADQTALLTLLGAAYVAGQLEVQGAYNFFDGTNGTANNGTYDITNTSRSQLFTGFPPPTTGAIVEIDNVNRVFYERITTQNDANAGKFLWYRWTKGTDGKFYICPDLNGSATTLEASKTEFAGVLANPGTTANPNNLGVEGVFAGQGCNGVFWSRLEPR